MKITFSALFRSAVSIPFFSGCSHGPADRPMGGWDHMMGYGHYGGLFMWLILIIIAGVIVSFVLQRGKRTGGGSIKSAEEPPTEILKRRYAKGEITKEEFDRLKKEIEG